ncbi:formyltransferase family protein [Pontibacterium sp.]|uniref:formyltransferase family protein n=1 Tax=Pontibacterium sp. TaxID=2036026 RepID=UPI003513FE3A
MIERVLFLGEENCTLLNWLRHQGEDVFQTCGPISPNRVKELGATFLVSYGYRHILRKDVLDLFPGRAINLHISYLPWNRGADPNFWSFVENTPKGVTIHYIDEGLDTGDILLQKKITFALEQETLASSYRKLHEAIQQLFIENWIFIKEGRLQGQPQAGEGTLHKTVQMQMYASLLTDGWDTPVSKLVGLSTK